MRHLFLQSLTLLALGSVLGTIVGRVRGFAVSSAVTAPSGQCAASLDKEALAAPWIPHAEARTLHANPNIAFIDARPRHEFEAEHVAGALNAPAFFGSVDPELLRLLATADAVVVYGDSELDCKRARTLARLLRLGGIEDLRLMEGSFSGWLARQSPTETGPCALCPAPPQPLPPNHPRGAHE